MTDSSIVAPDGSNPRHEMNTARKMREERIDALTVRRFQDGEVYNDGRYVDIVAASTFVTGSPLFPDEKARFDKCEEKRKRARNDETLSRPGLLTAITRLKLRMH